MNVLVGKTEVGNYYYISDSLQEKVNQNIEDNKNILDSNSKQIYSTKNKDKLEDLKSINSRTKSYYSKSNYSSSNSSSSSNSDLNSDSSNISESTSKQKNLKRYESNDDPDDKRIGEEVERVIKKIEKKNYNGKCIDCHKAISKKYIKYHNFLKHKGAILDKEEKKNCYNEFLRKKIKPIKKMLERIKNVKEDNGIEDKYFDKIMKYINKYK